MDNWMCDDQIDLLVLFVCLFVFLFSIVVAFFLGGVTYSSFYDCICQSIDHAKPMTTYTPFIDFESGVSLFHTRKDLNTCLCHQEQNIPTIYRSLVWITHKIVPPILTDVNDINKGYQQNKIMISI